jgi:general stress protein 26
MLTKGEATKEAMEFLKRHTVGVLATATLDGQPFASPVYYAVQPDFSIYFLTSHHTQKFKNLVLNPRVAFCFGTGPEYTVVNIHGAARVTNAQEREEGMKYINELVNAPMTTWPIVAIHALETGGIALYKITPERISYLNLTSKDNFESMANYVYEIFP